MLLVNNEYVNKDEEETYFGLKKEDARGSEYLENIKFHFFRFSGSQIQDGEEQILLWEAGRKKKTEMFVCLLKIVNEEEEEELRKEVRDINEQRSASSFCISHYEN